MSERSLQALGAPDWAVEVVERMTAMQRELTEAMGDFSKASGGINAKLDKIDANQGALKQSFELFRDEARAKDRSLEDELKEVRGELTTTREEVATLRSEVESLRSMVESDGK